MAHISRVEIPTQYSCGSQCGGEGMFLGMLKMLWVVSCQTVFKLSLLTVKNVLCALLMSYSRRCK
jgi:hypothetical protein